MEMVPSCRPQARCESSSHCSAVTGATTGHVLMSSASGNNDGDDADSVCLEEACANTAAEFRATGEALLLTIATR